MSIRGGRRKAALISVCVLFSSPSGGFDEKHQHNPAALPVHQACALPELHQVSWTRLLNTAVIFSYSGWVETLKCFSGSGWSSLSTSTSSETPLTAFSPTTFSAGLETGEASRITWSAHLGWKTTRDTWYVHFLARFLCFLVSRVCSFIYLFTIATQIPQGVWLYRKSVTSALY